MDVGMHFMLSLFHRRAKGQKSLFVSENPSLLTLGLSFMYCLAVNKRTKTEMKKQGLKATTGQKEKYKRESKNRRENREKRDIKVQKGKI